MTTTIAGFPVPLAGILAGLIWAKEQHPHDSHVLTVPCDMPFLPPDLVNNPLERTMPAGADFRNCLFARHRETDSPHPAIGGNWSSLSQAMAL